MPHGPEVVPGSCCHPPCRVATLASNLKNRARSAWHPPPRPRCCATLWSCRCPSILRSSSSGTHALRRFPVTHAVNLHCDCEQGPKRAAIVLESVVCLSVSCWGPRAVCAQGRRSPPCTGARIRAQSAIRSSRRCLLSEESVLCEACVLEAKGQLFAPQHRPGSFMRQHAREQDSWDRPQSSSTSRMQLACMSLLRTSSQQTVAAVASVSRIKKELEQVDATSGWRSQRPIFARKEYTREMRIRRSRETRAHTKGFGSCVEVSIGGRHKLGSYSPPQVRWGRAENHVVP